MKYQHIENHILDPSIEYYGIKVIGDDPTFDEIVMSKYPKKIKIKYSNTQNRSYAMNLCNHCGTKQGNYFIYRQINEIIKKKQEIRTI